MLSRQKLSKWFGEHELWISIFFISLTTFIAHGLFINRLGYYHDDWSLLWSGVSRGADSIITMFSTDRPFMGVVYFFTYRLLGNEVINWHLYALLWRLLGGLAFFWILRLLWPEQKYLSTIMTVLFMIYPGFLSQPDANTKQNHLYGMGTALFSIAFMLQAIKVEKLGAKIIWMFLSVLFTANYLWIYEYMIGFEGMRLVLLGYRLWQTGLKKFGDILRKGIQVWWPYPTVISAFLYWRLFIFESTRNATNQARLFSEYLVNWRPLIIRFIFETLKDFFDTTVFAWFVMLHRMVANADYSKLAIALLVAGVVSILVLLYSGFYLRRNGPQDEQAPALGKVLILFGAMFTLFLIIPVVFAGKDYDLGDSYKSYGLHPISGVILFVTGLLLQIKSKSFRLVLITGLVFGSVCTQVLNNYRWIQFWDYQKNTWWQLTWRAPDIEDNTFVMAYLPDGYQFQQDYEIWGPLNLVYRPGSYKAPTIQAEILNGSTMYSVFRKEELFNRARDIGIQKNYQNLLLLSTPSQDSCMHVIDGKVPVYSEKDSLLIKQVGAYSQTERIIPDGKTALPPQAIFGAEPEHGWCYFFQKASLARQNGKWSEISAIYSDVETLGVTPADRSEYFPFIEGLVNSGKEEEAKKLYRDEIKGRTELQFLMCAALSQNPNYPPEYGYEYEKITGIVCK